MNIKIGSLFAGIGGIEKGFLDIGDFDVWWANEIDEKASRTYKIPFSTSV